MTTKLDWIHLNNGLLESSIVDKMLSELGPWAVYGWIGLMTIWTQGGDVQTREINGKKTRGIYKRHSLRFLKNRLRLGTKHVARLLYWLHNYRSTDSQQHIILDKDSELLVEKLASCKRQDLQQRYNNSTTLLQQIGFFWHKLLIHNERFYDRKAKHSTAQQREESSGGGNWSKEDIEIVASQMNITFGQEEWKLEALTKILDLAGSPQKAVESIQEIESDGRIRDPVAFTIAKMKGR